MRLVESQVLVALALTAACSSVSGGDPSYWDRSRDPGGQKSGGIQPVGTGGTAGAGASPGSGGASPAGGTAGADGGVGEGGPGGESGAGGNGDGTPCTLSFHFTTVTSNGRFSPRNVGAVWVMSLENRFVKTLELWAEIRANHLVNWQQQTGAHAIDAVTGATASAHRAHEARWDCRDVNGNFVSNGSYKLFVEFTEDNSALFFNPQPKLFSLDFSKGSDPATVTPADQPSFTNMVLTIQ